MVADAPLAEAVRINDACRQHGVAFVKAEIRGVFANVFSDFGPAFTVLDVDGARLVMCKGWVALRILSPEGACMARKWISG